MVAAGGIDCSFDLETGRVVVVEAGLLVGDCSAVEFPMLYFGGCQLGFLAASLLAVFPAAAERLPLRQRQILYRR